MSDYFRFAAGARLDRSLAAAIEELKQPRPPAPAPAPPTQARSVVMPPVTLPKPRAAGSFFSLVDACEGSERRLDDLALPLHDEMHELEKLAEMVITEKRDGVTRARDYLTRLRGTVKKLEATEEQTKTPGTGDNGGPPTAPGSAASPLPSSDTPPSPPASSDTPPAAEPHGDAGE